MVPNANWSYPTLIRFGCGRIQELLDVCNELQISNPMVVSDPGLVKQPVFDVIRKRLADTPHTLFCDIKPNPVKQNIIDGVQHYQTHGCDGIIAMGGGSALDSAKTIAVMTGQKLDLWEYEDVGDNFKKFDPNGFAPVIAVPTTAGTGSAVGRAAIIIDEELHSKRFIFHPQMMPNIVIADPELTVSLPAKLTAATGMDALAHNLEAYCAKGFHPMADGIALEGMRLIKQWLPIAVKDGNNLEARSNLLAASLMGGTAFQKGLGAVHSLSHPIGAIYDLHHGYLNAVFMPYVLAFNKPVIEERLARLARYLDLKDANAIVAWLTELNHQFDISMDLASVNVDESHTDDIVKQAMKDPSTGGNPRECDEQAFRSLFLSALYGKVSE
ncbi:MAG: alcohol dehydrogenase [Coxiella sp. (in: Bacteria)]|nr:MAG: alcohol dehydrogenase [Coxiella sp. (in: g-proteobacteria)]